MGMYIYREDSGYEERYEAASESDAERWAEALLREGDHGQVTATLRLHAQIALIPVFTAALTTINEQQPGGWFDRFTIWNADGSDVDAVKVAACEEEAPYRAALAAAGYTVTGTAPERQDVHGGDGLALAGEPWSSTRVTVTIEPEPPQCSQRQQAHDFAAGVAYGSGGGVWFTDTCTECGVRRTTNTWATCRDCGENYESVTYEPEVTP